MRVRVIFRGLVLFHVVEGGLIEAHLISNPSAGKGGSGGSAPRRGRGSSPHRAHSVAAKATDGHSHTPEIQIAGREVKKTAPPAHWLMAPAPAHAPARISASGSIDIVATGGQPVHQADSFIDHVPHLTEVIARATEPKFKPAPKWKSLKGNSLVHTIVTINGGTIRAKDVVTWDVGANGLTFADSPLGRRAAAPAEVKLLGSELQGHMASECVVDIKDVTHLAMAINGSPAELQPLPQPNVNASQDMVEIIVENYPPRLIRAVPWGMDFQWLFEAAGFAPADLVGREFSRFEEFAREYDNKAFQLDFDRLLSGGTNGYPFPYVLTYSTLKPLSPSPLTDLWDRPLCVHGRGG